MIASALVQIRLASESAFVQIEGMEKPGLNLTEYLRVAELSVEKCSVLVGVNNSTMYRWLHGGGIDGDHLRRLVEVSEGRIDPMEVVKEIAQAKAARRPKKAKRAA